MKPPSLSFQQTSKKVVKVGIVGLLNVALGQEYPRVLQPSLLLSHYHVNPVMIKQVKEYAYTRSSRVIIRSGTLLYCLIFHFMLLLAIEKKTQIVVRSW
jgi:hypothetical protein